ncbi:PREDICTED: protein AKNAD1 [Condylura cristata]|uniref:protein AKNAD1 n=1 Tax=Condylura cristata TaxID=143302 RepID=UPI00033472C4|nr:PREDICTED: protein AKNAD1 [Condylura cristata]
MAETDFSDYTTFKQQENLPYDGDFSQRKRYSNYSLISKNDGLGISNQMILTAEDYQEKAVPKEICSNAGMIRTVDKRTENGIDQKPDREKQHTTNLHTPRNKGGSSKSNISDVLLHHLSKEEFLKGNGINGETLPEMSNADSFDDTTTKNIILQHVGNDWPKGQTRELTDQLSPEKDKESTDKPCGYPTATEKNTCKLEGPMEIGESSHQENPHFLAKIKSLSDKQKRGQEQALQKRYTEKANFKCGQDQVHCQFSGFSKAAPRVSVPKNKIIDRPLTLDKQTSSSPKLRDKSAIVQDMLEGLSRSNFVEKQEQKRKTTELVQQTQMGPTTHIHQGHVTGIEAETSVFKLSSTSQKDFSSSSYIFQKLTRGNQMCQLLKGQTDQLKSKVQEFAKSIAQESPYCVQDKRLVLEKLQGHLEFLEQEFLATKEMHLTSQQQVYKHDSPALSDFDPERKVEGEIFKLEMLLGDVKEKIEKGKCPSAPSLPVSSPIIPDDLASSPPSDEEDPNNASRRQDRAETTSPCCAFCHRVLEWQQRTEGKGHGSSDCGRAPIATQQRALRPDSMLSSDMGHGCPSASGLGLQSNRREGCGMRVPHPGTVCSREPPHKFLYRYDTPEHNYLHHSERCAFVQLCFLNENKNSSPSYSKPKCICSQRAKSKSSQEEYEPIPGKKNLKAFMTYGSDLAASSPHSHSGKIFGGKSLCNVSSTEEMETEILNTSLDHALRTAITLKETTDQMIKTIAEDLAKVQSWRNRLNTRST